MLRAGFRAFLVVPLVREDRLIGLLVVRRRTPGQFHEAIIELLQTFATQSALAIQNARLFHEIEDKGRLLEAASRHGPPESYTSKHLAEKILHLEGRAGGRA